MEKHHYRNVFKSDHLGSADLEDLIEKGSKLIFTIQYAKQEKQVKVAGKKVDANIVYFKEPIKPLVINATNGKILRQFANSPMVEDWNNILVELYIDENVKSVSGGITQGVRIRPVQPKLEVKIFTEEMFERAKNAKATIESIKKTYQVSEEVEKKYLEYAAT